MKKKILPQTFGIFGFWLFEQLQLVLLQSEGQSYDRREQSGENVLIQLSDQKAKSKKFLLSLHSELWRRGSF